MVCCMGHKHIGFEGCFGQAKYQIMDDIVMRTGLKDKDRRAGGEMSAELSLTRLLDTLRRDFPETFSSRSDKTKRTMNETAMILQPSHFSVIQQNCVSVYTIPHHPIIFQRLAPICTHTPHSCLLHYLPIRS